MQAAGRCAIVTAMAVTRAIELRTDIPGPKSKEILERKEREGWVIPRREV